MYDRKNRKICKIERFYIKFVFYWNFKEFIECDNKMKYFLEMIKYK